MIQKKICMIGTSAVGKTSLVARFVHSMFSDRYLTTVGVKIEKKTITQAGDELMLMIWDLAGDDEFQRLQTSFLRGTDGYILVADGTRAVTLDQVEEIQTRVAAVIPNSPFVLALNKADLISEWTVPEERLQSLAAGGWKTIKTSAKDGSGVEETFAELACRMTKPA